MRERTGLSQLRVEPEPTLGLGPTYRELRARLGWTPTSDLSRRTPMDVNAGRGFVFVSHVGTAHPSGFLTASAGDVRANTLNEIYCTSRLLTDLRNSALLGGRGDLGDRLGDVRGLGLFVGVELVRDRATLEPAGQGAGFLADRMRGRGALLDEKRAREHTTHGGSTATFGAIRTAWFLAHAFNQAEPRAPEQRATDCECLTGPRWPQR